MVKINVDGDASPAGSTRPPAVRRSQFRQSRVRGRSARRERKAKGGAKRRRVRLGGWKVWVFGAIGVVVAAIVAAILYGWFQWNQVPHPKDLGVLPAVDNVESILIAGTDTRTGISDSDAFGGATEAGSRSDTLMVFVLPPGHAKSTLLSIPRDLRVDIPGRGQGKINGALNRGAQTLVDVTQDATGLTINHYVEVNFDGFRDLSTAVGGVEICVDHPIRDSFSDLNLDAGCHKLEGDDALAWVRSRHAEFFIDGKWVRDPQSDLSRIKRQQDFLQSMLKAMMSPASLVRFPSIAAAAKKSFTVDEQFTYWHLLHLSLRFIPSPSSRIIYATLPVSGQRIGGVDFVVPQQPQANQLLDALRNGDPPPEDLVNDPSKQESKN